MPELHVRLRPEDELHLTPNARPEGVGTHRLLHQRRKAVRTLAEVDRTRRQHYPNRSAGTDHRVAFKAPITAAIAFALAPGPTRTMTPSISSSIPAFARGAARWRRCAGRCETAVVGSGTGAGASTTAGTNARHSPPSSLGAIRASRRQPKTCCGRKPCRRATSETTAPGANVSSKIRALSSADHRRRPPAPLMTSMRRATRSGSSVRSNLDTKRSPIRDRQTRRSEDETEGAIKTTLTPQTLLPFERRRVPALQPLSRVS